MCGKNKKIEIQIDDNGCHNCTSHQKDKNGYTVLCFNNKRIKHHRYVYSQYYLGGKEIPEGLVVRHKCDNPTCVNPEHLEIGTPYDNSRDRVNRKRHPFGENNGRCILKENQVIEIFNSDKTDVELSAIYGVNRTTIANIRKGIIWKYLTEQLTPNCHQL